MSTKEQAKKAEEPLEEEQELENQEADDDEFDVEIIDDTPEEDRGRDRRPEGYEPDIPDDEEIDQYETKNARERIRQLRWEFHEERRAKEEAARTQDEAINYAKRLYEENKKLKKQLSEGSKILSETGKSRFEGERAYWKGELRKAYDEGDSEKIAEAQEKLAGIVAEEGRFQSQYGSPIEYKEEDDAPPPQFKRQQQAPKPDERTMQWYRRNQWFGQDQRMTAYALGVHQELVTKEGVNPQTEDYFRRLDQEMAKTFPDKFPGADESQQRDEGRQKPERRQGGTVVAPASRGGKGQRRTVRLTATQERLRKRLGLTREQYVRQLQKEQSSNE